MIFPKMLIVHSKKLEMWCQVVLSGLFSTASTRPRRKMILPGPAKVANATFTEA
ncbi:MULTISPECIES: hypothetical protein [Bradyrhizobium]|uniref:hypothetical protein n=1 Tax=Bradyrhizobium elkanii TaxID=29448 RepID=UPI0018AD52F7|nr:hypothetical protein [Bradyrhizobium elkanii]